MAIKVKHEGSAASRIAAKADGGRAKRAQEAAAFAKGRDIQQKQAATAHASAPSISAAPVGHAQLIGAPGAAPLGHTPSAGGLGASVRFGGGGGKIETQTPTQTRNPAAVPTVSTQRPYTTGQLTKQRPLADAGLGGFKTMESKMHRRLGNSHFNKDQYDSIVAQGGTIFEDGSYILPNKSMTQAERIANIRNGGGGGGGGGGRPARRSSGSGGSSRSPSGGERYYSPAQVSKWDDLENSYQDAAASGRYTPEELAELRKQVDFQKMNIKSNPFERLEKKPSAQDDINSRLVTVNGTQYYRNAKGDLELPPTPEGADGGWGDFQKWAAKNGTYTDYVVETDLAGKQTIVPVEKAYTPQQMVERYNEMRNAFKSAATPQPTAQPGADPVVAARSGGVGSWNPADTTYGRWREAIFGEEPASPFGDNAPVGDMPLPNPVGADVPAEQSAPQEAAPQQEQSLEDKWADSEWK